VAANQYDPLPDLAALVQSALWGRRDVTAIADRITDRLGLGEDDSPEVAAEVLRKALGLDTGDPAPLPEPGFPDVWVPLAEGACGDGITEEGEGIACGVPAGHLRRHERASRTGGMAHWPNPADPETGREPQPETAAEAGA
jgi:hypothetical protein